jgi:hypothetical protein
MLVSAGEKKCAHIYQQWMLFNRIGKELHKPVAIYKLTKTNMRRQRFLRDGHFLADNNPETGLNDKPRASRAGFKATEWCCRNSLEWPLPLSNAGDVRLRTRISHLQSCLHHTDMLDPEAARTRHGRSRVPFETGCGNLDVDSWIKVLLKTLEFSAELHYPCLKKAKRWLSLLGNRSTPL